MRKLFAMLLCLAVMLSLVACGKNEDAAGTTGQAETVQTIAAATTGETVADTTETTAAETNPTQTEPEATNTENTKPSQTTPSAEPTTPKAPSIQSLSQKEQFEAFAGVVGLHYFDAVEKLGWTEGELTAVETSYFSLPMQVYLEGTKFQVWLGINEQTHRVSEVLYRAEVPTKTLEVAEASLQVVEILDSWAGKNNQLEVDGSFLLRDTTQADVSAGLFMDEWAYSMISWDYSKHATAAQKTFAKECGDSLGFGVFLEVSRACLTEGDKVTSDTCTISFSVGLIPV